MNIFRRELKANRRSLIIWCVIVILFTLVGVSKFSAYYGNTDMLKMLDAMPSAMLDALNMRAFNLTTVTGFYGIMFTYFALMLCIAAVLWGSDIIVKEERDKTVEFSLTLPVSRNRVVTAKAMAALTNCVVLWLITWGASLVAAQPYSPDSDFYNFLQREMVAIFIMQMVFLAVGLLLGCAMKQYKRVAAVAVAILLGTYFMSIIQALNANLDFLKYFTPFKYFDPGTLLRAGDFDMTFVLLSALIIVVCVVAAHVAYSRRDLYI
jgi:ABC-2 type transport system permease protein